MTAEKESTTPVTWVAMDIAKRWNEVLVEGPDGRRQRFKVANSAADHDAFVGFLHQQPGRCEIALEPTGVYHRPIAYRLAREGFHVSLISSVAAARYRDVTFNSWDKNDPKDARVILDLLKQGRTLRYYDPILAGIHDLQELSKTYMQVSLARTRLHHSLFTHYLPLYWPEIQRFWHSSRAQAITCLLDRFPIPEAVRTLEEEAFTAEAWDLIGRKVSKRAWLKEFYRIAQSSIGLPVDSDGLTVHTIRVQLRRYRALTELRAQLEDLVEETMGDSSDFALLKSIPGIGPVHAMVILAEAGDLRRISHHRQFLKFCGLPFEPSTNGTSVATPKAPIASARHSRRWLARSLVLRTQL
jgi:transposase